MSKMEHFDLVKASYETISQKRKSDHRESKFNKSSEIVWPGRSKILSDLEKLVPTIFLMLLLRVVVSHCYISNIKPGVRRLDVGFNSSDRSIIVHHVNMTYFCACKFETSSSHFKLSNSSYLSYKNSMSYKWLNSTRKKTASQNIERKQINNTDTLIGNSSTSIQPNQVPTELLYMQNNRKNEAKNISNDTKIRDVASDQVLLKNATSKNLQVIIHTKTMRNHSLKKNLNPVVETKIPQIYVTTLPTMKERNGPLPGDINERNGPLVGSINKRNEPLPGGINERNGPLPGGVNERNGHLPDGINERNGPLPDGINERNGPLPGGINERNGSLLGDTNAAWKGNKGKWNRAPRHSHVMGHEDGRFDNGGRSLSRTQEENLFPGNEEVLMEPSNIYLLDSATLEKNLFPRAEILLKRTLKLSLCLTNGTEGYFTYLFLGDETCSMRTSKFCILSTNVAHPAKTLIFILLSTNETIEKLTESLFHCRDVIFKNKIQNIICSNDAAVKHLRNLILFLELPNITNIAFNFTISSINMTAAHLGCCYFHCEDINFPNKTCEIDSSFSNNETARKLISNCFWADDAANYIPKQLEVTGSFLGITWCKRDVDDQLSYQADNTFMKPLNKLNYSADIDGVEEMEKLKLESFIIHKTYYENSSKVMSQIEARHEKTLKSAYGMQNLNPEFEENVGTKDSLERVESTKIEKSQIGMTNSSTNYLNIDITDTHMVNNGGEPKNDHNKSGQNVHKYVNHSHSQIMEHFHESHSYGDFNNFDTESYKTYNLILNNNSHKYNKQYTVPNNKFHNVEKKVLDTNVTSNNSEYYVLNQIPHNSSKKSRTNEPQNLEPTPHKINSSSAHEGKPFSPPEMQQDDHVAYRHLFFPAKRETALSETDHFFDSYIKFFKTPAQFVTVSIGLFLIVFF